MEIDVFRFDPRLWKNQCSSCLQTNRTTQNIICLNRKSQQISTSGEIKIVESQISKFGGHSLKKTLIITAIDVGQIWDGVKKEFVGLNKEVFGDVAQKYSVFIDQKHSTKLMHFDFTRELQQQIGSGTFQLVES